MIYYFMDRQFNPITVVDSDSDNGIIINNDIHTTVLDPNKPTLLNELDMDIYKNTGPKEGNDYISAKIKEGGYVIFQDKNSKMVCLVIMAIEGEDEEVRPIHCEDLGMELINGSATPFESKNPQYINYYIERELYDTGWSIGINEIGTDIKKLISFSSNETPLARIQNIAKMFNAEISFNVEFQNLNLKSRIINIYRSIGTDKTERVYYSGVDIVSMTKSVDIYDVVTALRDEKAGFNDLVFDDGRFYTLAGESIVYDRYSNSLYGRGNTSKERFSGWIMGEGVADASSPMDKFNQLKNDLEKHSTPAFDAKVDMIFNAEDVEAGDWITLLDEDYNPALRLKVRINKKIINYSNPNDNSLEISNFELLESKISSDLIAMQNEMQKEQDVYQILFSSNNGTVFIDGVKKVTTLTVTVLKNGVDITTTLTSEDIIWYKQDANGVNDVLWEKKNENSVTTVEVDGDDVNDISTIRCTLVVFNNKYVNASYFLNGLKVAARKAIRLQSPFTITSALISDTHYATDTATRDDLTQYTRSIGHIRNVVELSNFIDIDFGVLSGDVHDGGTPNKDVAMNNFRASISAFSDLNAPYFVAWGNHDDNSWGDGRAGGILKVNNSYKNINQDKSYHGKLQQSLTNAEMYDIATRPSTVFDIVENPKDKIGYYYYDVPEKNNRVIILNSQDIPKIREDGYVKYLGIAVAGYRQQQITWLYETLKNTPEGMHVSIYQHYSFGYRYSTTMSYLAYNYEFIDGLVDAFVSGGTFSRTYSENPDFKATLNADFQGKKGIITYLAHGHHHNDRITKAANGIVDYSIGCSVSRPKKDQRDRPLGVLEEDLWDIVLTNTKTRTVNLIRFGKGTDRSFTY